MRTRVLVLAVLLCLPVPGGAQSRQDQQMSADLRILQEQVARLQLANNQQAEQLRALAKRLDDQAAAGQKQFADLQVLINNVSTTVNTVREKLDDNSVRVTQLMQELPSLRTGLTSVAEQLNTLVSLLQPPPPIVNPDGSPAPGVPSSSSALGTARVPESPTRLFDAAKADYVSNRIDSAIEGFTEFVEKFPDAPQAAEAQFWIGESYRQKRALKEAIAAYDKLIGTYKTAPEVPEAQYMKGLCYLELGQRTEARRLFELIVKQYPGTSAAALAQQKLVAPASGR
ncbi:MAG: tol-pal system protein YbgF [Acidobacteria bacterium]|nr:tol-pal system protein YbgF [Acidobacteriota bacterium]